MTAVHLTGNGEIELVSSLKKAYSSEVLTLNVASKIEFPKPLLNAAVLQSPRSKNCLFFMDCSLIEDSASISKGLFQRTNTLTLPLSHVCGCGP